MPTARYELATSVIGRTLYALGGAAPNAVNTVEAFTAR